MDGQRLSVVSRQLLRESVLKHRPDCMPVIDQLNGHPLPDAARDALREAVVAELSATGLDAHDEPNQRGQALEQLIDLLGRL